MQHVQRMRRISTPRTRAESDFAECSDASLPPPFFFIPLPPSRANDGSTSAAIFSTGPSRWAALLRDEPGFEYGKFPFKDQRRDRRVGRAALWKNGCASSVK